MGVPSDPLEQDLLASRSNLMRPPHATSAIMPKLHSSRPWIHAHTHPECAPGRLPRARCAPSPNPPKLNLLVQRVRFDLCVRQIPVAPIASRALPGVSRGGLCTKDNIGLDEDRVGGVVRCGVTPRGRAHRELVHFRSDRRAVKARLRAAGAEPHECQQERGRRQPPTAPHARRSASDAASAGHRVRHSDLLTPRRRLRGAGALLARRRLERAPSSPANGGLGAFHGTKFLRRRELLADVALGR